jgi:hypothetical protein
MMLEAWTALVVLARAELTDGRRMLEHCMQMKL